MSKKSVKLMFRTAPKHIRKQMMELDRHPQQRPMQLQETQKPKIVTLLNGETVRYEGP